MNESYIVRVDVANSKFNFCLCKQIDKAKYSPASHTDRSVTLVVRNIDVRNALTKPSHEFFCHLTWQPAICPESKMYSGDELQAGSESSVINYEN